MNTNWIWITLIAVLVILFVVLFIVKSRKKNTTYEIPEKFSTTEARESQLSRAEIFIKLLGGKDNIEEFISCKTRLKVIVKDPSLANDDNEAYVNNGAGGLIHLSEKSFHIIVGHDVSEVSKKVEELIK